MFSGKNIRQVEGGAEGFVNCLSDIVVVDDSGLDGRIHQFDGLSSIFEIGNDLGETPLRVVSRSHSEELGVSSLKALDKFEGQSSCSFGGNGVLLLREDGAGAAKAGQNGEAAMEIVGEELVVRRHFVEVAHGHCSSSVDIDTVISVADTDGVFDGLGETQELSRFVAVKVPGCAGEASRSKGASIDPVEGFLATIKAIEEAGGEAEQVLRKGTGLSNSHVGRDEPQGLIVVGGLVEHSADEVEKIVKEDNQALAFLEATSGRIVVDAAASNVGILRDTISELGELLLNSDDESALFKVIRDEIKSTFVDLTNGVQDGFAILLCDEVGLHETLHMDGFDEKGLVEQALLLDVTGSEVVLLQDFIGTSTQDGAGKACGHRHLVVGWLRLVAVGWFVVCFWFF